MAAVAILRDARNAGERGEYCAIDSSGKAQSIGRTAGEALDALTAKLAPTERGTIVVVQNMEPDAYFTASQIERLKALQTKLEYGSVTAGERAELEALIEAELLASADRMTALADSLGR